MSRAAALCLGLAAVLACQPGQATHPRFENHTPTAQISAPALTKEGAPNTFSASGSSDPDHDDLVFAWDFGDGVAALTENQAIEHAYRNDGTYSILLVVTDSAGAADTTSASVTVANVAPQVTVLRIPDEPVQAGTPARIEIQYSDPGIDDTTQAWVWFGRSGGASEGSGLLSPGIIEWTFFDPGQYTVGVTVEDNDGASMERYGDHPIIVVATPAPAKARRATR